MKVRGGKAPGVRHAGLRAGGTDLLGKWQAEADTAFFQHGCYGRKLLRDRAVCAKNHINNSRQYQETVVTGWWSATSGRRYRNCIQGRLCIVNGRPNNKCLNELFVWKMENMRLELNLEGLKDMEIREIKSWKSTSVNHRNN